MVQCECGEWEERYHKAKLIRCFNCRKKQMKKRSEVYKLRHKKVA